MNEQRARKVEAVGCPRPFFRDENRSAEGTVEAEEMEAMGGRVEAIARELPEQVKRLESCR